MFTKTYQDGTIQLKLNEEATVDDVNNFLEELNGNKKVIVEVKEYDGGYDRENLKDIDKNENRIRQGNIGFEIRVTKARDIDFRKAIKDAEDEVMITIKLVNDHTAEHFMVNQNKDNEYTELATDITEFIVSIANKKHGRKTFNKIALIFDLDEINKEIIASHKSYSEIRDFNKLYDRILEALENNSGIVTIYRWEDDKHAFYKIEETVEGFNITYQTTHDYRKLRKSLNNKDNPGNATSSQDKDREEKLQSMIETTTDKLKDDGGTFETSDSNSMSNKVTCNNMSRKSLKGRIADETSNLTYRGYQGGYLVEVGKHSTKTQTMGEARLIIKQQLKNNPKAQVRLSTYTKNNEDEWVVDELKYDKNGWEIMKDHTNEITAVIKKDSDIPDNKSDNKVDKASHEGDEDDKDDSLYTNEDDSDGDIRLNNLPGSMLQIQKPERYKLRVAHSNSMDTLARIKINHDLKSGTVEITEINKEIDFWVEATILRFEDEEIIPDKIKNIILDEIDISDKKAGERLSESVLEDVETIIENGAKYIIEKPIDVSSQKYVVIGLGSEHEASVAIQTLSECGFADDRLFMYPVEEYSEIIK